MVLVWWVMDNLPNLPNIPPTTLSHYMVVTFTYCGFELIFFYSTQLVTFVKIEIREWKLRRWAGLHIIILCIILDYKNLKYKEEERQKKLQRKGPQNWRKNEHIMLTTSLLHHCTMESTSAIQGIGINGNLRTCQ